MMIFLKRFLSSAFFWSSSVIIPIVMEIVPAICSAVHLLHKRRHVQRKEKPLKWPEISIIIPVYNSADSLLNCVKSIADSGYPADAIRIYLVNNGSSDFSFQIFQKAQLQFPELEMQWMNSEQGKARALNLALYNSFGKYVINIDSDGVLEKHALFNLISEFEMHPEIGCMTGTILTNPDEIESYKHFFPRLLRKMEFVEYAQAFLAGRSYASDRNALYTLSGAFSAFRKSAILKSQLYSTATLAEDTQITFQMERLFHQTVKLCDDAIYFVSPVESAGKLYTQRQRWQRGSLEVSKMFEDQKLTPLHIFTDVNLRTMLYDHTFAFPRVVWYFALAGLYLLGYSAQMILFSIVLVFFLYILVSFLYYWEISIFLKKFPSLRTYYRKQWWVVILLPGFNFYIFFIRFIGILNSENTRSAWHTRTFQEEKAAFRQETRHSLSFISDAFMNFRKFLNQQEVSDHAE